MCKFKKFIFLLVVVSCIENVFGMTEAQVKAAVKLVRNVCQPKSKATDDDIENMHKGVWEIDKTAKCYMFCALNMYKLLNKDNTFNYESAVKQMKALPPERIDAATVCMEKCKDSIKTFDDKCEAAYEIAHCMYDCNPENYFLP